MPAYNEEKRIGKTLESYLQFFSALPQRKKIYWELLVVINGTTDNTEKIVIIHEKTNKNLKHIVLEKGGKGFAITEGFKKYLKTDFGFIGFVDADLATYPAEYFKLIEEIEEYDGVIANRYDRDSKIINGQGFRRIIISRVFNFLVRSLFLIPYEDTQCGAKIFKREAVKKILDDLTITKWAYDVNLLYACKKNNLRIKSVPTVWYDTTGSKLNVNKVSVQMFFAIVQLRIMNSPFRRILKIFTPAIKAIYKFVGG